MHNLKDFGALGDGSTDDSTAIAAWLAAAGSTNPAYAPAGTYICNSSFVPTGTVIGDGIGKTIFKVKNTSSIGTDVGVFAVTTNGTRFANFTIDGNKANNQSQPARLFGLAFTGAASDAEITGVEVKDMPSEGSAQYGGDGIFIATSGGDIRINDVRLSGCERSGIGVTKVDGLWIDNVYASGCELLGIDLEPDNDSSVIKNVFLNNVELASGNPSFIGGGGLGINGRTTTAANIKNVIGNNIICRGNKIYGITVNGCDGVSLSNVHSFGNSTVGSGSFPNVVVGMYATNVTFSNGNFTQTGGDNASYGISVLNDASVSNINVLGVTLAGVSGAFSDAGGKIKNLVRNALSTAYITPTGAMTFADATTGQLWTVLTGSVANNAVLNLTTLLPSVRAMIFINESTGNDPAIFYLKGGNNATIEMVDPNNKYSITATTAGSVNIYYSSGYQLENKSGGAVTFQIAGISQ